MMISNSKKIRSMIPLSSILILISIGIGNLLQHFPSCYASNKADIIINRQLSASISASTWPTTPTSPLCEAYCYFDSSPSSSLDKDQQRYYSTWKASYLSSLHSIIQNSSSLSNIISTYDDGIKLALKAAQNSFPSSSSSSSTYNNSLDKKLLSFALATRAHSPQCEMYRSLAQHAMTVLNLNNDVNAFVVVVGTKEVYTSVEEIQTSSQTHSPISSSMLGSFFGFSNGSHEEKINDAWANILPKEDVYYKGDITGKEETSKSRLILYGQFHTNEFASLLEYLQEENIPHVVRYIGYTTFESDDNDNKDAKQTFLQGYGVKVDIRNLEYKSYDEKESKNDSTSSTNKEVKNKKEDDHDIQKTLNIDVIKEQWIKGIDSELLSDHSSSPELQSFIKDHLPHLETKLENYDKPIIPPRPALQNLSLAAATVINQSVDPLWTLIQLSQNLPSHAYALSNVTIPESITKLTETKLMKIPIVRNNQIDGLFQFYINGRRISVERPSFNLFQLLNVVREENAFLQNIQHTMKDYLTSKEAMDVAASLISMGKENFNALVAGNEGATRTGDDDDIPPEVTNDVIRIDVGRGYKNAILYFNDIEKDVEYASWPTEIQSLLMSLQYGRPPTIRRNMITVLMVIDPLDSDVQGYLQMMGVLFQFIQAMYPIRFGVLLANDKDIEHCKESILSAEDEENHYCLIESKVAHDEDVNQRVVTTQQVFMLLNHVLVTYGGMIAMNYFYVLIQSLNSETRNNLNVDSLIKIHNNSLYKIIQERDDLSNLKKLLFVESSKLTEKASYEKAVRFAVTKNIKPGMTFVNGILVPQNDPEEVNRLIQDEVNHLVGMVLEGKITSARKSIYALVLTGPKVYKKMHFLLAESTPRYHLFSSYFDDETLVTTNTIESDELPRIVCEAYIDFNSVSGLKLVESFLSSIKRRQEITDSHDQVNLSFRVLPNDVNSAFTFLGKVFRNASTLGLDTLLSITQSAQKAVANGQSVGSEEHLNQLQDTTKIIVKRLLVQELEYAHLPWESNIAGSVLVNGRLMKTDNISADDFDVLIELEIKTAKIISTKLLPLLNNETQKFAAVARLTSFMGDTFVGADSNQHTRADALMPFQHIIKESSPLFFDWQTKNDNDNENNLKVSVTAIFDPLSEATQRAAPLIRTLRDDFNLSIKLLLVPRLEITEESKLPITSYYRFVSESLASLNNASRPSAFFQGLPADQVLTIRMDVPEPWDIQQGSVVQDTDNLRCDEQICGDYAYLAQSKKSCQDEGVSDYLTQVQYNLNSLLLFGQCYDVSNKTPPNGLQFTLSEATSSKTEPSSGTLVMKTVGYWQLQSKPGVWKLQIAEKSRGAEIYEMVEGDIKDDGQFEMSTGVPSFAEKILIMKDFVNSIEVVLVKKRPGYENEELFKRGDQVSDSDDDMIHVFSLATGHLYERFLKIMMLSVTKRASKKVKFWLLENFLSPSFKSSAAALAQKIGCEVQFITYKWPEWLRAQSEKQRIIWGYKILFLDVLFPLNLKKVIYVDADQVVRGDLKELMDLDLQGAPYGYTPMCESREETKGYQFWRSGFWPNHLRGKPYHISALYVVDLHRFRRQLVGDQLRSVYQQLTADPNNLSNLDQDLPNYTQHQIPIKSLPQDWLWCESWCTDDTKATSKTIDLCNNPGHKEAKLSMAKRIISGPLFKESWVELDEEVANYEKEFSQ